LLLLQEISSKIAHAQHLGQEGGSVSTTSGTNQEHVKAAGRDFSVSPPIGPKPPG
jgi:hypothetical protein